MQSIESLIGIGNPASNIETPYCSENPEVNQAAQGHVADSTQQQTCQTSEPAVPLKALERLDQLYGELRSHVAVSAAKGDSFDHLERWTWQKLLQIGHATMEVFIASQGDGDLGEQVVTEDGTCLRCSDEPTTTKIRSVFGEHSFQQFTYGKGKNKKIQLWPLSTRMLLPAGRWSYFLEEMSQMFCVDQAFNQAAANLDSVFKTNHSIDTLEQTNARMGQQADAYLDALPTPPVEDEGQLLVASADCKGVPLIKEDSEPVAAFEQARKRPGNRRMATVASVYSVNRFERTAEQIVDALFRERKDVPEDLQRPQPVHKHTSAHLPTVVVDEGEQVAISGIHEGISWMAEQVHERLKEKQQLLLLMDGQESLWDTALLNLSDVEFIEILDIIHVASYVWEAAGLFYGSDSQRKEFTRERLLRILRGEIGSVIRGLRRMASQRHLGGKKLNDLKRICGYFEKHQHRMAYDRYLAEGYPIASGVVEGGCCHLVKDRMERSGMRWTLEGARSMLNLRAVFQSSYWDQFCQQRVEGLTHAAHPHRRLLDNYQPTTLAC